MTESKTTSKPASSEKIKSVGKVNGKAPATKNSSSAQVVVSEVKVKTVNPQIKITQKKESIVKANASNLGNKKYATGKRKNAIARVWVMPGKGVITVNGRDVSLYFPREFHVKSITKPFVLTNTMGHHDVLCTVKGGGISGQAGAVVHGISKALDQISSDFHSILRQAGLLTRDPRVVERKKYGKHKARKSTQFSKR